MYIYDLSEYCSPPSERAGTPENVPAGTHLFVVVNYDANFPAESVTSLPYLFVIFSSIHHFVDYKHYRPTRGTRVSYNSVPGFFFVQRSLRFFSYFPFVFFPVFLHFPPVDSTHGVVSSPLCARVCNGFLVVSLTDTHRRT